MSDEKYIVDLSGAKVGTEVGTVAKVEEFVGALPIVYLASQNQEFNRRDGSGLIRYAMDELADDDLHFAVIRREIDAALIAVGAVVITSYLARVGNRVRTEYNHEPRIRYMPLAQLSPSVSWNSSLMTQEEIVNLIVETMAEQGSVEIEQQALRGLLTIKDPRFDKPTGPAEWKVQGFIGMIVGMAADKGYVTTRPGVKPPQVFLKLTKVGIESAKARFARTSAAAPSASVGTEAGTVQRATSEKGKDAEVQVWWDILSKANLDPRQQIRPDLYSALEKIVIEEPGQHTGTSLIKLAVRHTRDKTDGTLPWERVQHMFRELCRAEAVMLEGGEPVVPLFGREQPKVDALVPQFAVRLDARFLTMLIELGGEVHEDDTWRIGAAFFNSRAAEPRAEEVLYFALESGLLTIHPQTGRVLPTVPVISSKELGSREAGFSHGL